MINRILSDKLKYFAGLYPVVSVTGPQQTGKTTLVKHSFVLSNDFEIKHLSEKITTIPAAMFLT